MGPQACRKGICRPGVHSRARVQTVANNTIAGNRTEPWATSGRRRRRCCLECIVQGAAKPGWSPCLLSVSTNAIMRPFLFLTTHSSVYVAVFVVQPPSGTGGASVVRGRVSSITAPTPFFRVFRRVRAADRTPPTTGSRMRTWVDRCGWVLGDAGSGCSGVLPGGTMLFWHAPPKSIIRRPLGRTCFCLLDGITGLSLL